MSETEPKKRGFFSRLFGRDEEPSKPLMLLQAVSRPVKASEAPQVSVRFILPLPFLLD